MSDFAYKPIFLLNSTMNVSSPHRNTSRQMWKRSIYLTIKRVLWCNNLIFYIFMTKYYLKKIILGGYLYASILSCTNSIERDFMTVFVEHNG